MTFFLKKRTPEEQAEVDTILTAPIPSFAERRQAQATETRILRNFNDRRRKTETDYVEELLTKIPEKFITAKTPENSSGAAGRYDYIFESVRRAKAADPSLTDLPETIDQLDSQVDQRRRSELDEARDVLDMSNGWGAEIVGYAQAEITEPENIPFLFMGAGAGMRFSAAVAAEAVAGGIYEARTIGAQRQVAEDLGTEDPNVLRQVGFGALAGGAFAGVLHGGGAALRYRRERAATTGTRRPTDQNQLEFGEAVDTAEEVLRRGDDPAPSAASGRPAQQDDVLLDILRPDQAASVPIVRQILDFTGDLEAPKGYDQIWSGIRPQDYPPKPLTQMTIREVLDWQDSIDPRYQSEASGRFQFMEDTLRPLYQKLGLTGDELFDAKMQDRLAIELMREKGLDDFLAGRLSARDFGQNLSKVWAGLPQLTGGGRGRSFYDGLAGNKSLASADRFEAVLGTEGAYTPLARGDGTPYQGGTSRGYTREGQVTAGDNFRIDVEYQVVDLPTLTRASGDLQPRDRSRAASDEQINEIASRLDPQRLLPSPEADRGAPIVGSDNIIESGNGRVMGIQRAYERFPDRAAAYREQIEAAGFAVPEGMQQPVLIARRQTDMTPQQRSEFVRSANISSTARMSAPERAAMDARAIDSETIAMFDPSQPLTSQANAPFTRRFLNALPQAERAALVDATGRLNAEGVGRVRQATFARAFDDPSILARYAEADAGELRSLMDALEASAPAWAGMRNAISEGRVRADLDVTPFVMDAMRLIADARRIAARENKTSASMVDELLADVDLLEGATAPLTAALVRKFYPEGRVAPAAKVSEFLDRFAAEAQKVGRTDASLFDDAVSDIDVLKAIDPAAFGKLTETGKARIPDTARPLPRDVQSDAMPEQAFANGASSPEAQEAADELAETLRVLPPQRPTPLLQSIDDPKSIELAMVKSQPFKSFDELFAIAPEAQEQLREIGERLQAKTGAAFKNPGLKARSGAKEKMVRKRYDDITRLTDISRGGFIVETAEQADAIVADLALEGKVLDEGWRSTPAGYADRKVLFQGASGVISEIQIWSPELLKAKNTRGHKLYAQMRAEKNPDRAKALELEMRSLYADALSREAPSFVKAIGTSSAPKTFSNVDLSASASGKTLEVSNTSAASTASQDPLGLINANASPRAAENSTAGRPSQSQNIGDVIGNTSSEPLANAGAEVKTASIQAQGAADAQAIRDLVDDIGETEGIDIPLADGTTITTRQILDDLDQDEILQTVIDACSVKGAR